MRRLPFLPLAICLALLSGFLLAAIDNAHAGVPTSYAIQNGYQEDSIANPHPVVCESGCAAAANASVNLNQVAGSAVQTGHGTAAGTVRVELPTDGTGQVNALPALAGSAAGLTPVSSAAVGSNLVIKNAAGALYDVYVTTGSVAGYLMIFNLTSAPSDGAVTPAQCIEAPANTTVGWAADGMPSENYSTGITAVFSSTGCFTKTASATAFFHGRAN